MAKLSLHFSKSGLQTTIQDQGRLGFLGIGVPISGAMDKSSAKIANHLVGNALEAPVLEVTLIGPEFSVEGKGQMALAGADLSPKINGKPVQTYETLDLTDGDVVSFGKPVAGCRCYIAFGGSWSVSSWLDSVSASASTPEATPDSFIRNGTRLSIETNPPIWKRVYPAEERPSFSTEQTIRVMKGPEFEQASATSVNSFLNEAFKISTDSNRMGYRLEGMLKEFKPKAEVISSGIVPGTIQVTNEGQPIILLADAQTSGGYFRIANVITEDLNKLAQMKPGDQVSFELLD